MIRQLLNFIPIRPLVSGKKTGSYMKHIRLISLLFFLFLPLYSTASTNKEVSARLQLHEPKRDISSDTECACLTWCRDLCRTEGIRIIPPDQSGGHTFFGAHKPNYILPLTWTFNDLSDRQGYGIKFQISVKQRLIEFSGYTIFFGYTQKSFWQAYDRDNSSPFRETNYNPELFLATPQFRTKWGDIKLFTGYEHESNGEVVPLSRSWNRIYLQGRISYPFFLADYKIWYRLPEKEKENPDDAEGDDNPDIHHYYGYSELTLKFNINQTQLGIMGRVNAIEQKGAIRIDLSHPVSDESVYWYMQYWHGYGESLIDYNRILTRFGIGIIVQR